jgi:hypothetical protein
MNRKITRDQAVDVMDTMGIFSTFFKKQVKAGEENRKNVNMTLVRIDDSSKTLASAMSSMFTFFKKTIDAKKLADSKATYAAEETRLEATPADAGPAKPATNSLGGIIRDSIKKLMSSTLMQAAILASFARFLPEEARAKLKIMTEEILKDFGLAKDTIEGFIDTVKNVGIALLAILGGSVLLTLTDMVTGLGAAFLAFKRRIPLNAAGAAAAAALGAKMYESMDGKQIVEDIEKDIENLLSGRTAEDGGARPSVSSITPSAAGGTTAGISDEALLKLVKSKESGGNYNVVFGGNKFTTPEQIGRPLTQMTVDEVIDYQEKYLIPQSRAAGYGVDPKTKQVIGTGAVGAYQITNTNMRTFRKRGIVKATDIFSPALQETLAREQFLNPIKQEARGDLEKLAKAMNRTWEGVKQSEVLAMGNQTSTPPSVAANMSVPPTSSQSGAEVATRSEQNNAPPPVVTSSTNRNTSVKEEVRMPKGASQPLPATSASGRPPSVEHSTRAN